MTESQVLEWLTRLVVDGYITEDEAAALFEAWEAGDFDPGLNEPLTEESDDGLALLAALFVGGIMDLPGEVQPTPAIFHGGMSSAYPNTLQDWWTSVSRELAGGYTSGRISLGQLARSADYELQVYHTSQHLGGYRNLNPERLQQILLPQRAYMGRFMDEVALRQATGNPMSEAYIANRMGMYGGAGRGAFYRGEVEWQGENMGLELVRYNAVDDGGTCDPCHRAQGIYLADDPALPMPGTICFGGSRCRCWLEYIYES